MRATFEFDVAGTSRDELNEKAEELIAKFLSVPSIDEAMSMVDTEMKVSQSTENENIFIAHVHVRIR